MIVEQTENGAKVTWCCEKFGSTDNIEYIITTNEALLVIDNEQIFYCPFCGTYINEGDNSDEC